MSHDPIQVLGLGGAFLRARDPEALRDWYAQALALPGRGGLLVPSAEGVQAVWQCVEAKDPYFGPQQQAMLNYRVASLDAAIAHLKGLGVAVEGPEERDFLGRFAWATDPEGHRFELWEAGEDAPRVDAPELRWRLDLAAPPERVWAAWTTHEGRCAFWASQSEAREDGFFLRFANEPMPVLCRVLESEAPRRFVFTYYGHTRVQVDLLPHGTGTELQLREEGFPSLAQREAHRAGWVSVLLNLKAWLEHGVDLRSPDPQRGWNEGFCAC